MTTRGELQHVVIGKGGGKKSLLTYSAVTNTDDAGLYCELRKGQ